MQNRLFYQLPVGKNWKIQIDSDTILSPLERLGYF